MAMTASKAKANSSMQVLDELVEVAKRCGITVRRERLLREIGYRARSGACRLKEKNYVILDREQSSVEQLEALADILREHPVQGLELSARARRLLGLSQE
jgi:ribonuclease P protein component